MKVTIGKEGLRKTWQTEFPETTICCRCGGEARIGFVAHEGIDDDERLEYDQYITSLHTNMGGEGGDFWLHDCCAVATYFCKKCLEPTSLYNQG